MDDCSKHKKDLFGETDMKKVAEAIGDLHYESLSKFLWELQTKFHNDSINDIKGQRFKLGHLLHRASKLVYEASNEIERAWQISKYFMKETDNECAGCGRNVNHCVCP